MVSAELDRLEASDIITKVERSDWAAPTVNVVKTDKSIRACGDYKVTVNPHVMVDKYPLPTAEDIFATLVGGEKFTKLDLAHAHNQLELDVNEDFDDQHTQGFIPTQPIELWR